MDSLGELFGERELSNPSRLLVAFADLVLKFPPQHEFLDQVLRILCRLGPWEAGFFGESVASSGDEKCLARFARAGISEDAALESSRSFSQLKPQEEIAIAPGILLRLSEARSNSGPPATCYQEISFSAAEIRLGLVLAGRGDALLAEAKASILALAQPLKSYLSRQRFVNDLLYSEQRFRTLFDQSPLGIQVGDTQGKILMVNPAWVRLWNLPDDVVRNYILSGEYNVVDDPLLVGNGVGDLVRRAIAGESIYSPAMRYDPSENNNPGRARWVESYLYPIKDESSRVRELVIAHADVTDRISAEQALRESEERFRGLVDSSFDAICVHDNGKLLQFNPSFARMFGYEERQMTQLNVADLVTQGERLSVNAFIHGHVDRAYETLGLRKDGTVFNLEVVGRDCFLNGQPARIAALRDITERKRNETQSKVLAAVGVALSESLDVRNMLERVAELCVPSFSEWCVIELVGKENRLERVASVHASSSANEAAWELNRKYPIRRPHPLLDVVDSRRSQLVVATNDDYFASVAKNEEHFEMLRRVRWRSALLVPLLARGRTLGVMAFHLIAPERGRYDAQHLAFAEELARRAALAVDNARLFRRAQNAIRLRDEFFSIAAHELRTPLTPLRWQIQALNRALSREPVAQVVPPPLKQLFTSAESQVDDITRLVEHFLDVSRIQAGKLELLTEDMDLGELVERVLTRFAEPAAASSCTIHTDIARGIVGFWDRFRLEQVVNNLLSNAVKYGRGSAIEITVQGTRGNKAFISVRDHGIGIAPSEHERVFERFERAAPSDFTGGLGLGLYISREIVNAHKGQITLQSETGKGATFTVELPWP